MSDEVKATEQVAKHTPGPWTAECVVGNDPHDICGPDRPGEGSPNLLASVAYDFDDPLPHLALEEANANARLIAAAPDLLAALTRLVGTPVGWDALNHEPGCGCVGHEARYAICKVLGLGKEHAK